MADPNAEPHFLDSIRWPLIVGALLLGHFTFMLVAFTLATADPPTLVNESPYAATESNEAGADP